jgi:hypothetical protein
MTRAKLVRMIGAVTATLVMFAAAGLISIPKAHANQEASESSESKVQEGLDIAPVPLNLDGKNRELVGLGSYIVNGNADCNACHTAAPAPGTPAAYAQYLPGGNPYLGEQKIINPATYLGGGRDFGALVPNTPHIVSRNLTPDKTGLPVGGDSFSTFAETMRTGLDPDHLHPTCSATVTTNCIPPPYNGELLQIMPWPLFHNLTDHDLRAIYEYLSAIPCISGPPAPSTLHHDCE